MASLVEIIFKAVDETKAALGSIQAGMETVSAAAADTNTSLGKVNEVLGSEAMLRFKDAAVAAFGAVRDAAGEFVTAAADAELVGVRMEATLRALGAAAPATAGQINDLADELSKLTGFDDEALVEAQTTLARIGSVAPENFERATRAAVDLAAATGMDLNSAFQAVGIALENADFGRLARQIGDLPPEMQNAAKAALDMGDTLKVQEIILDGIEQKVGGVGTELGDTFAGQMNKLRTEYGNFQESVGTPLLKLFTGLPEPIKSAGFMLGSMGETFGPVISSVADMTIAAKGLNAALGAEGLIGALKGVMAMGSTAFVPLLVNLGLVALAVGALLLVWDQWNKQIVQTNEEGAKAVKNTWKDFFDKQIADGKSAKEVIDEYHKAQAGAAQALEDANPIVRAFIFNQDELTSGQSELEAAMRQVTGSEAEYAAMMDYAGQSTAAASVEVAAAGEAAVQAGGQFDEFGRQVELAFWGTLNAASTAAQQLVTIVQVGLTQVMDGVTAWTATILLQASQSAQMLVQIVSAAWQQMLATIRSWFERILSSVRTWWSGMQSAFNRLISGAQTWGRNIVEGLWKGIENGWTWLKNQISANIDSLLQWVQDLLGIASPSKLFADEVGEPIAAGIAAGFSRGMKATGMSIGGGLIPSPALATAGAGPVAGGVVTVNVTGGFYSPVTHAERARIRREQEAAAVSILGKALGR